MNLSDFNTTGQAKAHVEIVERTQSPDMVIAMLTEHDCVLSLQSEAIADDKAAGFLLALNGSVTSYDVRASSPVGIKQRGLLTYLSVIGAVNQSFVDAVIAYSAYSVKPFESSTLVQFNQAKGIYTEKEVAGFTQGKDIKITLIDVLPENCIATTWDNEADFEPENFGKVAHLKTTVNAYKLKTNSKKADGKLFVRIPLENFDFTVELV